MIHADPNPKNRGYVCGGAWLAVLAMLIPAQAAAGQAVLTGVVKEDSTGRPLSGVEVLVEGSKRQAFTDATGRYVLSDLPTGVRVALFRHIGYRPARIRVTLVKKDTVPADARLVAEGVHLAPIEVTGRPAPPRTVREAFEERRRNGTGVFIDSAELRRSEHVRLADVLRRNNVEVVQIQDPRTRPQIRLISVVANKRKAGTRSVARGAPNEPCLLKIILNGSTVYDPERDRMWPTDVNTFDVGSLESVEVYRSEAETPMEFSGSGGACGVLVLWSRQR